MLKTKSLTALAAVVAACALTPAPAQTTPDAPGVTVDLNGAALMHRSGVHYPQEALAKSVQGTVVAQVRLSETGEVVDARIVSGPDELRSAVLQSVLNWHFSRELAGTSREVNVTFELPKETAPPAQARAGAIGGIASRVPDAMEANSASRVSGIRIVGLSDAAKNDLLAQLPVHEGDILTPDSFGKISAAVKSFDEHLGVSIMRGPNGDSVIGINVPGAYTAASLPAMVVPPGTITVGGNVQQNKLASQTTPVYPPLAKQARIQGVVHLQALIGPDGKVQNLQVISGHPLLVQAALDAVKTWTYQPTLLNGNPVPVKTEIDVNFTLSQ